MPAGNLSDGFSRVDDAAVCRNVRKGDERHAVVNTPLECVEVKVARIVTGRYVYFQAIFPGAVQKGDEIACIGCAGSKNFSAPWYSQALEGKVPCACGTVGKRNFFRGSVQERGDAPVYRLMPGMCFFRGFVPSYARFQPEMLDARSEHRVGHKRCAGIVEMYYLFAGRVSRRVRATSMNLTSGTGDGVA